MRINIYCKSLAASVLWIFTFTGAASIEELSAAEQRFSIEFESDVFAHRKSAVVTEAEIRARVDRIPPEHRIGFLQDPNRFTEMLRNAVIEKTLFADFVTSSEFSKQTVQVEIFREIINEISKRAQNNYLQEHMLDDYSARARELYLSDPQLYREPETVSFRQIALLRTRRADGNLEAIASNLVNKLNSGAEFAEIALNWSDDPRVEENNGLYENRKIEDLTPDLAGELKEMNPGEIRTVGTDRIFFILELVEKNEGEIPEFDDISEKLEQRARQEHRARLKNRYLADSIEGELVIPEGRIKEFLAEYDVEWEVPEARMVD